MGLRLVFSPRAAILRPSWTCANGDRKTRRLWQSWEDYMREWVRREEFRDALPQLLEGEDLEFTEYIRALAETERK